MLYRQVLGRMKQLMVDNNTAASHSFLLDDDSSIPFSLDDIQNLMDEKARGCHLFWTNRTQTDCSCSTSGLLCVRC